MIYQIEYSIMGNDWQTLENDYDSPIRFQKYSDTNTIISLLAKLKEYSQTKWRIVRLNESGKTVESCEINTFHEQEESSLEAAGLV
jgi:hypothetical protein